MSIFSFSDPDPHAFLHKKTVIDVFHNGVHWVDQTPLKAAEQLKKELVQLDLGDVFTHASEAAKAKNEVECFFHDRQGFRGGVEPALGTKEVGVFAIDVLVRPVDIPGAESDLGARWKVDAFMGVTLGTDDSWEEAGGGRVVAESFLDACLEIWQF